MTTRALIEAIVDGLGLAAGREIFREANASIPELDAAPGVDPDNERPREPASGHASPLPDT